MRGKASVVDFQAEMGEKKRSRKLQPPESSPDAMYQRFNADIHETKEPQRHVSKNTMMKFIRDYQTKVFKKTLMPEAEEVKPRLYGYREEIFERIREEMVGVEEETHHHKTLRKIMERIKRRRASSEDSFSEEPTYRIKKNRSTFASTGN